jgi:hypothetical protein
MLIVLAFQAERFMESATVEIFKYMLLRVEKREQFATPKAMVL